jgi:16S rRNA (cytosine967-C5)-methyltransferase
VDPAREMAFRVLRAVDAGVTWQRAWHAVRRDEQDVRERRRAHEFASGAVRLQGRLDAVAARHSRRAVAELDPPVRALLRLGLYQLLEADGVAEHAAVHETVEMAKRHAPHATGFVNAVLRSTLRSGDRGEADAGADLATAIATGESHPRWLVERWLARFGSEATRDLCRYDNRRPSLCLRVNVQRTSRDALIAALPGATPGLHSPHTVRMPGAAFAPARACVEAGTASVQDESGALVAPLLAAPPGGRVLDLCAAPGGKACHAAELLGPATVVAAYDRNPAKLARVRDNAARLGLANIVAAIADARTLRTEPADAVLVDAPCSGLGVLARRPDARWRKQPHDLVRLQAMQIELLLNAARHVRPAGTLVYSVCSFEPEETTDVVRAFAAALPGFRPDDQGFLESLQAGPGFLYCLPQRHGTDGGFVARWRRSASD